MYKIGVVGDMDSITGFRAVGLSVFPCSKPEEAEKIVMKMAREEYAIIYIMESLAVQIPETIDKYSDVMLPAVIAIPDRNGSTGRGLDNVRKAVERAVGADILFGGDK
ncbi:MAG: V-type ATP synthase subunit F [Eubacteriales bacterium]|jgi:V/A-type H+-transporting ATPase subunit F|nr:V-type ATP synthase subunit F [Eubacteriales bacterium]